MNAFIARHKKFFSFYYTALQLSGWMLLFLGLFSFFISAVVVNVLGLEAYKLMTVSMPLRSSEFILLGLLGLGISQLIHYLVNDNRKPGLILRHGVKLLYSCVILMFVFMVIRFYLTLHYLPDKDIKNFSSLLYITSTASVFLFIAKSLVLIGLAQFLKRIMPVIEEHKSLV